jgi:heat shock protein HspQ
LRTFSIGEQVEHKLFGKGTITDVVGFDDSAKLTIEFKGKVSKMIVSKYVKLVKE